ncbi:MAG: phytoene/squalene synthase family protein [Planctomycetaceae bacterium]|jgi:15-cis-phytoene synthase|nr:phytoene/squalene synthase family protein [Planctomycetaceae bacterium]MBT6156522.1 phytoene/squalene synthase family protein [Planctomycetaceae bacterium]MBT6485400.1 phytoene/squalene synthase family protein [Planctomycetaceae bacterium]MBT6493746.1 phytoene/squalene synthase family protein [Planctomycetaceae bacterium]
MSSDTSNEKVTEIDLDESYAWCKSLAKKTAGNFYYSFLTLPAVRQRDMCVLYAFMRVSDDLGDDGDLPVAERSQLLRVWRDDLTAALDGSRFGHALFPALADMVNRCGVPHEHLFAVLDGIEMDLDPKGFETFDELSQYCYRVAGAVGLCCIHVWGFHDERAIDRAIDCGLAFQLTNILRDLGEDAAMGRTYLPREDLRRFGYSAEDIAAQQYNEQFVELMQFEAERARSYFRRAEELHGYLEPAGKPIFQAMLQIYGGLLDAIERRNYDVYSSRVSLPRWRKLLISFDAIVRQRWLKGRSQGSDVRDQKSEISGDV